MSVISKIDHPLRPLLWMVGGDHVPGGHRVQLEQTQKYLEQLGVQGQVSFAEEPDLQDVDIVHGFGLSPLEIRRCRTQGIPVVLSTIYWDKFYITGRAGQWGPLATYQTRARMALVLLRSALRGEYIEKCEAVVEKLQRLRVMYEMADLLLPNSQSEGEAAVTQLGVTTPFCVVPNAVDHLQFHEAVQPLKPGEPPYVLCCARFEPHKNQLGLLQAMQGSSLPLILAGYRHPHHPAYYERCVQIARASGGRIKVLSDVPREDLPGLYRGAKVHVLPSWFETTGLVSLEAALSGCNIVTTGRGYAGDYFGDKAWYCDPSKPATIRQAVEAAYSAPVHASLRQHILDNFTWEHTARATLDAYEKVRPKPVAVR